MKGKSGGRPDGSKRLAAAAFPPPFRRAQASTGPSGLRNGRAPRPRVKSKENRKNKMKKKERNKETRTPTGRETGSVERIEKIRQETAS